MLDPDVHLKMLHCVSISAAVLTLLILTTQSTAQVDNCSSLASTGNCSFYDCLSTKFECNTSGYLIGFGKNYCLRYANKSSCFTTSGQAWITNVRRCLMQSIVNSALYNNPNTTCDQLETFAFQSHPKCYIDNGFCTDIFLSDQCQNLVCIENEVFTNRSLWSKQAIDQIMRTTVSCPSNISKFLIDAPKCGLNGPGRALVSATYDHLNCHAKIFDFMIVLDASGSIGHANFRKMRNYIANMLSNLTIGPIVTRVGVIRYSTSPSIVIPLGFYDTYSELASAIRTIPYIEGETDTASALDLLPTAFATARVSEGVPRVAAVLTDGRSNNPPATVQAAQAVHNDGIYVYSFGIGNGISHEELVSVASSGQGNVFYINSFSSSNFEAVLTQLQVSTCATPTLLEAGTEIAATIPKGSPRLLKYPFVVTEGMTLKVNITQGDLLIRGSFTIHNPNELTQDFSVMSNGNDIDYFISPELLRQSTDNGNNDGRHTKRQAPIPTNATDANVYLSIVGLNDNNTFILNTTFGDTTESFPSIPPTQGVSSMAINTLDSMLLVMAVSLSFLLFS